MRGARGATQRARATRTTPPSAARSARGPPAGASLQMSTAAPGSCTAQAPARDLGHPGGAPGRRHDPLASPCRVMGGPFVSPLFASWAWLLHTGCSWEAVDMTGHERHHERGDSRYIGSMTKLLTNPTLTQTYLSV